RLGLPGVLGLGDVLDRLGRLRLGGARTTTTEPAHHVLLVLIHPLLDPRPPHRVCPATPVGPAWPHGARRGAPPSAGGAVPASPAGRAVRAGPASAGAEARVPAVRPGQGADLDEPRPGHALD